MLSRTNASRILSREIKSSKFSKSYKLASVRNFSLPRAGSHISRSHPFSRSTNNALFAIANQYNNTAGVWNGIKGDMLWRNNNIRLSSSLSYEDDVDADTDVEGTFYEKSRKEAWMVNLRGGQDNMWLTGPRDDSWFTGVSPNSACPGTDRNGEIRSLPLPNLSKVTRESALEYFDNSWTLYETLFAGLKGEDPFYR